jgi:hypothetical protein
VSLSVGNHEMCSGHQTWRWRLITQYSAYLASVAVAKSNLSATSLVTSPSVFKQRVVLLIPHPKTSSQGDKECIRVFQLLGSRMFTSSLPSLWSVIRSQRTTRRDDPGYHRTSDVPGGYQTLLFLITTIICCSRFLDLLLPPQGPVLKQAPNSLI